MLPKTKKIVAVCLLLLPMSMSAPIAANAAPADETQKAQQLAPAEAYKTYKTNVTCQIVNYKAGTVTGTVTASGSGNTLDKAKAAARKNAHKQLVNGEEYMRHCTYSNRGRDGGGHFSNEDAQ